MRTLRLVLVGALTAAVVAGCSDQTQEKTKEAVRSASSDLAQGADTLAARAVAEELRAGLKLQHLREGESPRDVRVLNDVVRALPGNPRVTGITDADGDGKDDDGKVETHVDDGTACLTISADGNDTNVDNGPC